MPKTEIVCGTKELKKNQRRGTMMECAEKKQIKYYGIKKVDKIILDMINGKKTEKKTYTLSEAVGKASGLKARANKIVKEIAKAKKKGDDERIEKLKKEFTKVKTEYTKIAPIANKLIKEDEENRKAEEKAKKVASPKKSSKKSSKKNSK